MSEGRESQQNQVYAIDVLETKYPYINVNQGLWNQPLADLRRSIAGINPFSMQQIPTQDRIGLGLRYGNAFYVPNSYPNYIQFNGIFPQHYDPLSEDHRDDATAQKWKFGPKPYSHVAITADKLPRGCIREIQKFKRCEMVNGEDNCQEERNDILAVCPNWALDSLKEKARFMAKVRGIQNVIYRNAMDISPYNVGRTVADVSDKTWVDGTRTNLRPDTMWADERYRNISQTEVNEAKLRVAERQQRRQATSTTTSHDTHSHHDHHHNPNEAKYKTQKPLYP